jgi:5'(3')-deoxyribonucleotidase
MPGCSAQTMRRVGVDIDGVLCDHVRGLCPRIFERYGIELSPEMVTEWDLDFGPSSIAKELRTAYEDALFVRSLPPLDGAREAIATLSGTSDTTLLAVTSRPLSTERSTREWLDQHFESLPVIYSQTKDDLSLDMLVDDYPLFINRCSEAGSIGILFARPWNALACDRLEGVPGIRIARDWEQVCSIILGVHGQGSRSC